MDHEHDVLGGYIPTFVQHLKDTSVRLGLRIESRDQNNAGDIAEEAAKVHARSGWTPVEQDAFFRAISVHSRWRPDLVTACVPTKTEWEVWMYLEALEEGAAMLAMQQGGDNADMEDGLADEPRDVEMRVDTLASDSCSDSGSDMDEDEDACEPALEVSQAWIDAEERMASWIVYEEHLASIGGSDAADAGEVDEERPKRKRGRPRGAGKERAQSQALGQTMSNKALPLPASRFASPELTSTSARKPSRNPSPLLEQKRDVLMGHLDASHLLVLDGILREGDEVMKKNKSREGSVTKHGDERAAHDTKISGQSDRNAQLQRTRNVPKSPSNVAIDPILLALSGGVDPPERQSSQVPTESTHVATQGPSSSPSALSRPTPVEVHSHSGVSNTFTFSQEHVALTVPEAIANDESDLSVFSPRTRRRIRKRLYMRRQRASLRENQVEGAVDTGIEKLKPGKKTKTERCATSVASISVPCSKATSDAEVELLENASKKSKPGLTLPYKLKAQFAELGIDAAYLRGEGIDLLNLSALGRLMGLRSSLEHGEEEAGGSVTESIDARLIRHLQAAMVSFVTDVIHRAIVWREREMRLKQRSRAWRQGDQITVGAVEHAVEAIGARYYSHKAYFKALEAFYGLSTEANAVEARKPTDASDDPDGRDAAVLSLHRKVYTPLVHSPSSWKISPLTCLSRTYEREATRTRRGTSAEVDEDELMSDETDEEALEAELKEEDAADALDMQLAVTDERDLWDLVRRK